MKTLFVESIAGIAGDMFVASFLDAGLVEAAAIREIPRQLGLEDVTVEITKVSRATMQVTHVEVRAASERWKEALSAGPGEEAGHHTHGKPAHSHGHHDHEHPHHSHGHHDHEHAHHSHIHHDHGHGGHSHAGSTHGHGTHGHGTHGHAHVHYRDIDELLVRSSLERGAKAFARRVFRLLAEAEARAHGTEAAGVVFHEVGEVDSIVDVAMAGQCVAALGTFQTLATPVKLGRGVIRIQHGTHAVPPPASARLAVGFPVAAVPDAITRPDVELSTPTGLAILKALAPSFVDAWPPGIVQAQGMGGGTMDLGGYPNVLRVALLEARHGSATDDLTAPDAIASVLPYASDVVVELCCNIDDQTAEHTAWAAEQLLDRGAVDVWLTPIVAKKGRAAVCLSVLAAPADQSRLADWLLRNTSTFGVRYRQWDRLKLVRHMELREEQGRRVTYKIGRTTDGEILKEKPEYEEIKATWERPGRGGA